MVMNSPGITRTIVFAICTGLSLIASAAESEKALNEVKSPAAPVVSEAKPDDGAQQAAWEQKETGSGRVPKCPGSVMPAMR